MAQEIIKTASSVAPPGGYYQGFDLPPPSRPTPSAYNGSFPSPTATSTVVPSPPRSPTTTIYTTPAIALRHLNVPQTDRSRSSSPPGSFPSSYTFRRPTYRHLPPPTSGATSYSFWDLALLPVTVPMAVTQVMFDYSMRAVAFGIVCGVSLVRIASAITRATVGRWF